MGWFNREPSVDRIDALIKEVTEAHAGRLLAAMRKDFQGWDEVTRLHEKVKGLKTQVADLEIEKAKKNEAFDRRERELEHKVGLHRTQVEHEMTVARKEAELDQREAALDADRKRFEDQIKFHEERFTDEITGLKDILAEVIKRLPDASFTADVELAPRRTTRKPPVKEPRSSS